MMIFLDNYARLLARLAEPSPLIQVVLGPRQVGKTTTVEQVMRDLPSGTPCHYASADAVFRSDWSWIERQWMSARMLGDHPVLILDEIHKIENWSEAVKKLWDEAKRHSALPKVVLLGSSSLALQKGLSESLTGRFELLPMFHWNFQESRQAFDATLDQHLRFGGYPGARPFESDDERWLRYLKDSIIETVIEKDIGRLRRIERPALFRQVFELACGYPAQEISVRKLVGQLQDPGSIETIQHYLELLEGAFLVSTLRKFSTNTLQRRSSSPKIMPMCPALCTFARGHSNVTPDDRGRLFELIVGLDLRRLPGELSYWRHDKHEVDYVYREGKSLFAVEVKSGRKKSPAGLATFRAAFPKARCVIISPDNYDEFSKSPIKFLKDSAV